MSDHRANPSLGPHGVQGFRFDLSRMTKAAERITVLEKEISERERELKNQREEYRAANQLLFTAMEKMDVRSNGNAGYENRAAWFFMELYRQLTEAVATQDKPSTVVEP